MSCDLNLWPWNWCAMSHVSWTYPPANFGDRLLRLFVSDLWAIARCVRRPLDSGRGQAWSNIGLLYAAVYSIFERDRYRSNGQQQTAAAYTTKIDIKLFFGDKILDLKSDFRKFGAVAMLQCCGLSLEYCVRVWCKLIRKWPRIRQTTTTSGKR